MPTSEGGFLNRLHPEDALALVDLGRARCYAPRSVVVFEGDPGHELLIVRAGQVKVFTTSFQGREVVLDVLGPGDILGELCAIDDQPRSASATALTAIEVTVIDMARFKAFLADRPAVSQELLRSVAGRLRNTSQRQLEFGTADALGRVCGRLVEMMARYGHGAAGAIITAPLSQSEIAGWSGLSREAVVKTLAALRALGWIEMNGRSITVLDLVALKARASISNA